jgi:UDPglucose--hexose-1-phosphate uridylyltransferase
MLDSFDPERDPHRRRNALTNEWVVVSPHRAERPWLGEVDPNPPEPRPAYDPGCYLCPGNRRARGQVNPVYDGTFAFDNDFSALGPPVPSDRSPRTGSRAPEANGSLFASDAIEGACRVLCFSPRHDRTLADLDAPAIAAVVDLWAAETTALGARYPWVQVFENKGSAMGCSNPHPHGQIWASNFLPNEALKEDRSQRDYFGRRRSSLLLDYADAEIHAGARTVCVRADWLAVVPYWAVWPYETMILPRRQVARLPDLGHEERASLAALIGSVLGGYDRLFGVSVPYSMGWHGAPYRQVDEDFWQLHAHVYPPLLRSATVRKYMVGYEMLAEPQRDWTPERAAERLREAAGRHEGT